MLTQQELKKYVIYDPKTGVFSWNKKHNPNLKKGLITEQVGGADSRGYYRITIKGKRYTPQDLVWLYIHGRLPSEGNHIILRDKNRPGAAKYALHNMYEIPEKYTYDNKTHRRGVYKNKSHFSARIRINGKLITLGTYKTAEEASTAYELAKEALKKPADAGLV